MDRSPCCDAQLVLVSPPLGYECRECYERYDLDEKPGADPPAPPEPDICGAETAAGTPCQNDAATCPYH